VKRCLPYLIAYLSPLTYGFISASLAQAGEVKVAAAASLRDALDKLKPAIEKQFPGIRLTVTTGASGMLQQQIVNGAPIDVFISASKGPMDGLSQQQLLTKGSRKTLLRNDLVLIAPRKSELTAIEGLKVAAIKRVGIGEPRSVPAGEYALQTLTHFKLNIHLATKFVYAKDVRQVLSYVERGEVDAGFVYSSDVLAAASDSIKVVAKAPSESHQPIVYEIAAIERGNHRLASEVQKVTSYLESPDAFKIWQSFGFLEAEMTTASKEAGRAPL
jgi:molybdate transport system substrate-binding protein